MLLAFYPLFYSKFKFRRNLEYDIESDIKTF